MSCRLTFLAPDSKNPQKQNLPVLLAPNQQGLSVLEALDTEVESMWIIRQREKGSAALIVEAVQHICHWNAFPASEGYFCALYCESGAVLLADTESLLQVDERGIHWSAGSRYKTTEPSDEVVTIEAVVNAIMPGRHAAIVETAAGDKYSISHLTCGVSLDELQEGARLRCVVTRKAPRVLHASVLP